MMKPPDFTDMSKTVEELEAEYEEWVRSPEGLRDQIEGLHGRIEVVKKNARQAVWLAYALGIWSGWLGWTALILARMESKEPIWQWLVVGLLTVLAGLGVKGVRWLVRDLCLEE